MEKVPTYALRADSGFAVKIFLSYIEKRLFARRD